MKRIILLILTLGMLLSLTACADKEDIVDDTVSTVEVTDDAEKAYLESLPERDYGGQDFNILCTTNTEGFYKVQEMSSESIPNSVYKRNVAVEDKYGVKLVYESMEGNRSGSNAFQTRVHNSVMASDDGFDLIVGQCYYMLPLAAEGSLMNLKETEYLHWDMPWYSSNINDNGIINGKLYGASGSYIMSQISYAMGIFFNKQMYADQNFAEGDIYELVRNKEWTYEVFYGMCADFYSDLNNSGQSDDGDLFGYVYNVHGIEASIVGSDCPIVEYDAQGTPTIDNYYNDHLIDVFTSYFDFYNYSAGVKGYSGDDDPTIQLGAGKALFANAQLGMMVDCAQLRSSQYDYGIVPVPMYDSEQENYLTYTMRWELFYIPTNADMEKSSIILEYLNYTTEKHVIPAYWDEALNLRAADAPDDSEMLYLIRDCLYYDFASFYGMEMGGIYRDPTGQGGIVTLIEQENDGLSGWWSSGVSSFKLRLKQVIKNYS